MSDWSTYIQDRLGRSGTLNSAMILDAVAASMEESSTCDWKRTHDLTDTGKPEKNGTLDIAKDAAALANGDGGVIIYGVGEKNSKASSAPGVTYNDRIEQRFAHELSKVSPVIEGWRLLPVTADDGRSFLILSVPPDRVRLHSVAGSYPIRSGSHTTVMPGEQVEAAYRERFAAGGSASRRLDEMIDECARDLPDSESWVVAASVPHRYDGGLLLRDSIGRDEAWDRMKQAAQTSGLGLWSEAHSFTLPLTEQRPGPDGWSFGASRFMSQRALLEEARAEMRSDGSVLHARRMESARSNDRAIKIVRAQHEQDINALIHLMDLNHLVEGLLAMRVVAGVDSSDTYRFHIGPVGATGPVGLFWTADHRGGPQPAPRVLTSRSYLVRGSEMTREGEVDMYACRMVASRLALALAGQFGATQHELSHDFDRLA